MRILSFQAVNSILTNWEFSISYAMTISIFHRIVLLAQPANLSISPKHRREIDVRLDLSTIFVLAILRSISNLNNSILNFNSGKRISWKNFRWIT